MENMLLVKDNVMECVTVEIEIERAKNIIISCVYITPGSCIETFTEALVGLTAMFPLSCARVRSWGNLVRVLKLDYLKRHLTQKVHVDALKTVRLCLLPRTL